MLRITEINQGIKQTKISASEELPSSVHVIYLVFAPHWVLRKKNTSAQIRSTYSIQQQQQKKDNNSVITHYKNLESRKSYGKT